jgi:branched-chain amino acid transport system substrate-binding protein
MNGIAAKFGIVGTASAIALAGVAAITAGPGASVAAAATGTYKIGYVASLSGPVASSQSIGYKAAEARVDLQNANGGVNGHKIVLIPGDDQSSPNSSLTAAESVVSRGANVIAEGGYYVDNYASLAHSHNIPVVGSSIGESWGKPPNYNMFAYIGSPDPNYPAYTGFALILKKAGGTKQACVGNNLPLATLVCKGEVPAAKQVGATNVFSDTSLNTTTTDLGGLALEIKNSGANGAFIPLATYQSVPLMVALAQSGAKLNAEVLATGYGQEVLNSPTDVQAGQGVYFSNYFAPVELKTTATTQFQAALKKYVGLSGVPSYDEYNGWVAADQAILALKQGGKNPTGPSMIAGMQKVTSYNANGLLAASASFAKSKFGTYPQLSYGPSNCNYVVQLKGSKFVLAFGGKPVCGTKVSNSNQN